MRYSVHTCMRSDSTGTGALARVSNTGSSASENRIEARLNSWNCDGSPTFNRNWPQPAAK